MLPFHKANQIMNKNAFIINANRASEELSVSLE